MAGNVIELTDATFDEVVQDSEMPIIIDFWAPWCGPCKMMASVLEEVAGDYLDKAKICKLNTDDSRDSAMEFGVTSIPTIVLVKDGQMHKKWTGLTSKQDLIEAIEEFL